MTDPQPKLSPIIRYWIEQLLDPEIARIFDDFPNAQVDVRLSASNGKIRSKPTIILNGGYSEMVFPPNNT